MASSALKLIIREPPHRSFVQGYPGVPASVENVAVRPPAYIAGTVEVRPRPKGVRALYVRIELKKVEQVPGTKSGSRYKELIGVHPTMLWQSSKPKGGEDPGYDLLQSSDFPFKLPLPEGLPPSVIIDRTKMTICVMYEIVCTALVKPKGSSKDPVEVQESVPLVIEKHNRALLVADLTDRTVHAAWPIYTHQAAIEDRQALSDGVWMCAKRTTTSVGPGDTFVVTVQVRSQRVDPVKLGRLELVLREVVTFRGDLTGPKAGAGAGEQRTRDVVDTKLACKQALYTNELHSFDIQGQLPPQHSLVTVSTAKHISIAYSLRIRAHIERTAGTTAATSDVVIDQMATTVSSFPRQHGTAVVAKMMANAGPIPAFLDEPGNPSARQSTVSPHRSFASYDPRMSVIGSPSMPGLAVVGATPRMPSLSSRGSIGPSAPSLASHSSSHGSIYGGMAPSRSDTGSSHVPAPNPALYSDEPIGQLRSRTPASFAVEAAKQRLKSQAYVANRTDDDADDPYGLRDFEAPASDKLARERQRALVTLTSASASTSPAPPAVDGHWQSAEEEKARLFKAAVAQRAATTAATSSSAASSSTAFESAGAEQARLVATYASPPASTSTASSPTPSSNSHSRWMSAEEEKARLHAQALAAHAAHANGPVEPSSPVAASSAPRHGKKRSDTNATISAPTSPTRSSFSSPPPPPPISSAASEKAALAAKYAAEAGGSTAEFGVAASSSVASSLDRSTSFSIEKQRYLDAIAARERTRLELERQDRLAGSGSVSSPASPASPPTAGSRSSYFANSQLGSVDERADDIPPDYATNPPAGFSPLLSEKERMARFYASVEGTMATPPRSSSPEQFEPMRASVSSQPGIVRRTSVMTTTSVTSDQTTESIPLRRDPTIALGKKRAIDPPPMAEAWPNPYADGALPDPIYRVASPRLYGLATLQPLGERPPGPPPPRPSKTPILR